MPIDNQQPTLGIDYFELRDAVCWIIGVDPDESKWTEKVKHDVRQVLKNGLRLYYKPPKIDEFPPHQWSFLYVTHEIETADNKRWYGLPADFGHFDGEGNITYANENDYYVPIQYTSESRLRKLEYQTDYTSFPQLAAVRPLASRGQRGQRWEIGFHPTPNGAYRLRFQYHAAQNEINGDDPYPLGGAMHAKGILLACQAEAELFQDDQRGTYYQSFLEQLRSDIETDSRRGPTWLGYNSDQPWIPHKHRRSEFLYHRSVTYNNTQYKGS